MFTCYSYISHTRPFHPCLSLSSSYHLSHILANLSNAWDGSNAYDGTNFQKSIILLIIISLEWSCLSLAFVRSCTCRVLTILTIPVWLAGAGWHAGTQIWQYGERQDTGAAGGGGGYCGINVFNTRVCAGTYSLRSFYNNNIQCVRLFVELDHAFTSVWLLLNHFAHLKMVDVVGSWYCSFVLQLCNKCYSI